ACVDHHTTRSRRRPFVAGAGGSRSRRTIVISSRRPPGEAVARTSGGDMSEMHYWQRRTLDRTLGRRALLRGASVGAVGLAGAALIGCSSSSSSNVPKSGATNAPAGAAATEQPQVSDAFIAVQTRDATSLEP